MNSFKVEGGVKLNGDVFPQGAKNEALQVICAVILTEKEVIIDNIPEILDVLKLIDLLEYIGVKINKIKKNKYSFEAKSIDLNKLNCDIYNEKAKGLRGSIMVIGPLLSRFGKASIPKPGGDKIGRRRLDTHFESLIKLGAKFNYNKQNYIYNVDASSLKGNKILLFGSEGSGMHEHTSKYADFFVKIEINNKIESLNISNSAAIVFHHLSYIKQK